MLFVGMQTSTATMENSMEVLKKLKIDLLLLLLSRFSRV